MLTKEQLQHLKNELEQTKKDILNRFKDNDHFQLNSAFPYDSWGELSAYDNHPGDQATELYEREKDIALDLHEREHLRDIEHSLKAIENGTYGMCEVSGKEIPFERLEALPTATTLAEYSSQDVVSKDRPIEEETPFGQFEFDDDEEIRAPYDSEDSYQDVEKYGNSQTPQDMENPPLSYDDMTMNAEENIGNTESYENFIATDITGKEITVYQSRAHERYEEELDEEGIMTTFGDLHAD
ncbi:yteA family sporulation protein [Bacillus subtilis]|uniref:yteA family sporulation protein n=1 Tax=Bacillus subtilis TaxID=1423 RepID=UPI002554D36B|nr:yteA family sporulation protein [Bacillus subtilis]MDL2030192.1 yteA family sporulation protein [Bacillus subtilis]